MVKAEIDLRHALYRGKEAFILDAGLDDGPNVVHGTRLETHDPVAADQFRVGHSVGLGGHHGFVETGRQDVDQIDIGREFLMLLLGDPA